MNRQQMLKSQLHRGHHACPCRDKQGEACHLRMTAAVSNLGATVGARAMIMIMAVARRTRWRGGRCRGSVVVGMVMGLLGRAKGICMSEKRFCFGGKTRERVRAKQVTW